MKKRILPIMLVFTLAFSVLGVGVYAKTSPGSQTVDTVLFYVKNNEGDNVLVSHFSISDMEEDLKAGRISSENHNYSILDKYVTTIHQEAQGLTVSEFVDYAKDKSSVASMKNLNLSFNGSDKISLWEIDQTGFDDMDTYTYDELYNTPRYNYPQLYEYWDYKNQNYYDPQGVLSKDQVIEKIVAGGQKAQVILSVRAFSQRYMVTNDKYGSGDYNMENYWQSQGLLDNVRAIRLMKPMTEEELRNCVSSAADTRYWIANILLDMEKDPDIKPAGSVAAPTASATEDSDNYYVTFKCETPGALILYNHNFESQGYIATCEYTGEAVKIPKSTFPDGTININCRAVKDGCTDAGVTSLKLTASGKYEGNSQDTIQSDSSTGKSGYTDVPDGKWYTDCVSYVMENGLFDLISEDKFGPEQPMTRAMLASALYRAAGSPSIDASNTPFTDVQSSSDYADSVAWAYKNGIVTGKSDTLFDPNGSITREQITAMFYRYANNIKNADMSVSVDLSKFTDAGSVAAYASESMKWAVGSGLVNGTSDVLLSPKGTSTRAQVATMVQRLIERSA